MHSSCFVAMLAALIIEFTNGCSWSPCTVSKCNVCVVCACVRACVCVYVVCVCVCVCACVCVYAFL